MNGENTTSGPGDATDRPPKPEGGPAEAEIGVIIGRTCHAISEQQAPDYIAGYCLILDMTAEDILQKNPRFLTRSKNFDTFFSFGPELITPDEVPDVLAAEDGSY